MNLLHKSGDTFVAWIGTTGLGWWLQAIILFIVTEVATYLVLWQLRGKDAMKARAKENLRIGCYVWLIVLVAVYSPIFAYAVADTLYLDHESLVSENKKLISRNAAITADLDARKQHLSTTDPVFGNINALLMDFDMYRHARHGEPCVLWLSVPPESTSTISVEVAQFSNSVSDCFTFGPFPGGGNPEIDEEAKDGMIADSVIFHADKNDKAAFQLFGQLASLMKMRLSYKLPANIRSHYSLPPTVAGKEQVIWLQFGTNAKWYSEWR
jgi:hypothetical protein